MWLTRSAGIPAEIDSAAGRYCQRRTALELPDTFRINRIRRATEDIARNQFRISHGLFLRFLLLFYSIIETYHGLTTSKPLQLRCFQSG